MDVKVPEIGESIQEALIAHWLKKDGDAVAKDDNLCELETDKINVEVPAEANGILHIKIEEGETVKIGTVIATIEEGAAPKTGQDAAEQQEAGGETSQDEDDQSKTKEDTSRQPEEKAFTEEPPVNPAARQMAREKGIDLSDVQGSGRDGRVTVDDVRKAADELETKSTKDREKPEKKKEITARESRSDLTADISGRPTTREAMTPIRQKIAARLLEARQQTAMLTTFNEAELSNVQTLRRKHQEHFKAKHGIKLGLMSFFVKATIEALKEFPNVNAKIDGQDIVYHHYYDIGIAVGTDRGLVVPVLRNADQMTFAGIEQKINELGEKAKNRKLSLAELEGGTFTISNGGVYGSLLSTPIINPPQCGVLGMHAIQERPVVRDGELAIRPMMYLALSYDHRLIDGREAVNFLKLIKEFIEDPEELLLEL